MSIISKYLLKLHLVPFVFAMSACTSILLLNQIAKRLPDLLGKGLPVMVIVEVFALSVPFLVAMTLPMAVLVTVLYAVSRLAAENEITALQAGGVSLGRLARPLLGAGLVMTAVAFLFSDQVLPRSNHRLRTLLTDINRTKPTFALEEQVINEVQRNRFFLRANQIDQATYALRDVTIYDLTNQTRRRTIYADSGWMAFDSAQTDLYLTLYDGMMHESSRTDRRQFQVMNFRQKVIRVEGIGGNFSRSVNDQFKGDREMRVCEMDSVIVAARTQQDFAERRAAGIELNSLRGLVGLASVPVDTVGPALQGQWYCRALRSMANWLVPAAEAQTGRTQNPRTEAVFEHLNEPGRVAYATGAAPPRIAAAKVLRDRARSAEIRAANYLVEVHKKYAIAAASIVFVIVALPIAILFPRAGIGLVISVSLGAFAIYYVGLIGGESLGNQLIVSPFWAMWTPNFVFTAIGLLGLYHVRTRATQRSRRWTSWFGSTPKVPRAVSTSRSPLPSG